MDHDRFLFVALDYPFQRENLSLASTLVQGNNSERFGFKVNLDSIADFSPDALKPYDFIREMQQFGKPLFVDLKMWNGGRTMEAIARGCAELGVSLVNMYAHAGVEFMKRVKKSLEGSSTHLFGLTVLTHYTDKDTQRLYALDLSKSVRMLSRICFDARADGIIVPGTQLDTVKDLSLLKLCPAVRPVWYEDKKANAQEQIVTPEEAFAKGADFIVMGSPIIKSQNPLETLVRVLSEIQDHD